MAVTRQEFEAFLVCPLKSHLLAHGESAPGTALTEARTELGGTFQKHGIANLLNGIPVSAVSVGAPPTGAFKKHLFHFILDWLIATPSVKSRLDGAELIRSRESDKRLTYAPLRLLPDETVSTAAKLSLAFDGIALAHISGRKSPSGRIIHGREYVRGTVSLGPYYGKVQALIAKIEMQNSKPLLPPVSLNKHCAECEFQPRCLPIAREADDLSLLTKVSVKDREKYRNKGIFTVTQLSYTFRPRRRGGTSPKYDYSLKALAIRKNQIHLASYAPPDLSGTPVYFDVEGDPDLKFYYCVGLRYAKAGKTVTHSLWADTPSDERKMWDDFVAALCKIHSPRLVHYGNYEIHFLRQMSKRYGIKGEASFLDELISSAVNLVAVIYAKAYFPTYGNGLKDIAGYLGFRWTEAGASGLLAVARRRYWEYSGVDSLKQAILQYNAEDCAAAQVVAESLAALGGSPTSAAGGRGAIDVTTLKREFPQHFGALSCVLPEFEQINNAARWDYQRDKVYVRSNERIRRLRVERRPRQQTVPINKVVSCLEQRPVECSKCHGKKIYRFGRLSQTVYDLKLSGAAVRRWVVQYSFQRYICWNCKTAFQLRFHQSKYGITFRAFVVYHLIDLLLPQRALARSLQQLFGLPLSGGMINHVKADMAAFHEQTYRAILKRIVNGPLVHADETHVAVDGKVGYVWAFTNLEDVAFVKATIERAIPPRTFLMASRACWCRISTQVMMQFRVHSKNVSST